MPSSPATRSPLSRPSAGGKRWLAGCLTTFVLLVVLFLSHWPSRRIIHQWEQPGSVNYQSNDPYVLVVSEVSPVLSPWPRHHLFIHKAVDPTYGHGFDFELHNYREPNDPDGYVRRCTVVWATDGVSFVEPSGHKLFVPKSAFTGGR